MDHDSFRHSLLCCAISCDHVPELVGLKSGEKADECFRSRSQDESEILAIEKLIGKLSSRIMTPLLNGLADNTSRYFTYCWHYYATRKISAHVNCQTIE